MDLGEKKTNKTTKGLYQTGKEINVARGKEIFFLLAFQGDSIF